jgi:GntR family transcriptional repressor for pyruvate dehydrogenase complex
MTSLSSRPHGSLADDVAERVMTAISNGEFGAGDRLPTEPVLAQMLGVGRTSVREGIGKLRTLGAVEVRRGRGTYVTGITHSDTQMAFLQWASDHSYGTLELFEVRMALETTAASAASLRATPAELKVLEQAALEHLAAHDAGDLDRLVTTDQDFHLALVAASHNEPLRHVYDILVPQLLEYRRKSLVLPGAAHRSGYDHMAIVRAVLARDGERARQEVLNHLGTLHAELVAAAAQPTAAQPTAG